MEANPPSTPLRDISIEDAYFLSAVTIFIFREYPEFQQLFDRFFTKGGLFNGGKNMDTLVLSIMAFLLKSYGDPRYRDKKFHEIITESIRYLEKEWLPESDRTSLRYGQEKRFSKVEDERFVNSVLNTGHFYLLLNTARSVIIDPDHQDKYPQQREKFLSEDVKKRNAARFLHFLYECWAQDQMIQIYTDGSSNQSILKDVDDEPNDPLLDDDLISENID
jgi:hypothetical protein